MNKKLFSELVESMTQMGEIVRGERAPSREFHVGAVRELLNAYATFVNAVVPHD